MRTPKPRLSWSSERTLRVEFGAAIDSHTQACVHRAFEQLRAAAIPGVIDLTPAYTTLAATFDPETVNHAQAEHAVRTALFLAVIRPADPDVPASGPRIVDVPVDYGGVHGPDLPAVAEHAKLDQRGVVELHSAGEYTVCFLGFAPGFAYLAGLAPALAAPRLATPRARVAPGSVAIGGGQTAIYPGNTPGGWRLIGRARVEVFDAGRGEPALLRPGDRVRFTVATFAPGVASPGAPA